MTAPAYQDVLAFLQGTGTDHGGRTLSFVLAQSDEWLEDQHDFVQWIFPSEQASRFNAFAPVLSREDLASLGKDALARSGLVAAYLRMLAFWGLGVTSKGEVVLAPTPDQPFPVTPGWMRRPDHNDLRITRALACLHLVGLDQMAHAFLKFLTKRFSTEPHKQESLQYWTAAVTL